jgi:hypothetical protein
VVALPRTWPLPLHSLKPRKLWRIADEEDVPCISKISLLFLSLLSSRMN